MKGIEGWIASTVAPNTWHDEVAVEEVGHVREAEFHLEGHCAADFCKGSILFMFNEVFLMLPLTT